MKAIIHIGTGKTGTSTIQSFLAKNREPLKNQGIFVPADYWNIGNHIDLAAATFIPALRVSDVPWFIPMLKKGFTTADQDKIWEKIRYEIETNCNKDGLVLFSCEAFYVYAKREVERVKELMDSFFDNTTIIMYVRRQPEWRISAHSTHVQAGSTHSFFDITNRDSKNSIDLNYHEIVECWSVFGKDKIKIRIFDKQELHNHDLLSDFAYTAGFDITGLEQVKDENITLNSAEVEFLRLLNAHIPSMLDPWTPNTDRFLIYDFFGLGKGNRRKDEKDNKAYYLNRKEAQQILEQYREGNNRLAREYMNREKLFSEEVSMYPEEIVPHQLTLERGVEISADLLRFYATEIHQRDAEIHRLHTVEISQRDAEIHRLHTVEISQRDAEIHRLHTVEIHQRDAEIQCQQNEMQRLHAEIQRSHDNLALLQQKGSVYWHYYRCKVLVKITFGKKRKHYKAKRDLLHDKIRQIRRLCNKH